MSEPTRLVKKLGEKSGGPRPFQSKQNEINERKSNHNIPISPKVQQPPQLYNDIDSVVARYQQLEIQRIQGQTGSIPTSPKKTRLKMRHRDRKKFNQFESVPQPSVSGPSNGCQVPQLGEKSGGPRPFQSKQNEINERKSNHNIPISPKVQQPPQLYNDIDSVVARYQQLEIQRIQGQTGSIPTSPKKTRLKMRHRDRKKFNQFESVPQPSVSGPSNGCQVPQLNTQLTQVVSHTNNILIQEMFNNIIAPMYPARNIQQNQVQNHVVTFNNHITYAHNLFYMNNYINASIKTRELLAQTVKNSIVNVAEPRKRNRGKGTKSSAIKNNEDFKFEDYLTAEEVAEGLKNGSLYEGILRINPKNFQHSYVSPKINRNERDIFIDGIKNRNRSMEGDFVVVTKMHNEKKSESVENERKSETEDDFLRGKVVYIKEKLHPRTCIGSLSLMADKNRHRALFIPRDYRIPRLNIPSTSWPDEFYKKSALYKDTLFLAKIIDWWDTRFALGVILNAIGQSGEMQSETQAILLENELDVSTFGPEYRPFFPSIEYHIPEEEIKIREDCRNLCIFTIDPITARDLDDAVSCKQLGNGNFEVGVHIADLSHFLKENTILDAKVAQKATTVYMVEKAYHMLPEELCLLCSLLPGVDKLSFSVFWEMTPEGEVLSHRFAKTVMNSCCQMAYEHAQVILEGRDLNQAELPEIFGNYKYEDIKFIINSLGKMSRIMRNKRYKNGALGINQTKISIRLDPLSGMPQEYHIYESKECHQLIEEFMLLANMTVAKRIYEDHPKLAFLRCHPPPSSYMMNELMKSLKPLGINLNISSAGGLYESLTEYAGPDTLDKGRAMVLNMRCAKPMTRARYFCAGGCDDDDFSHYALNIPLYTHFTSPIRRYADVMVHRLLAASINCTPYPKWDLDTVQSIASQCNKQKFNAKRAGEKSIELYCFKYIEINSPVRMEAVVVDVKERFIDVIVIGMALNRRIFVNKLAGAKSTHIKSDSGSKMDSIEVIWNKDDENDKETKQTINIFNIINVEMYKTDSVLKIESRLVRPKQ